LYFRGTGVPQDFSEAVKWFRKAAEQGNNTGQLSLGVLYALGKGVPQNDVVAFIWLNLGSPKGNQFPNIVLRNITKRMTPAQIAEAQRPARNWMAKHKKK